MGQYDQNKLEQFWEEIVVQKQDKPSIGDMWFLQLGREIRNGDREEIDLEEMFEKLFYFALEATSYQSVHEGFDFFRATVGFWMELNAGKDFLIDYGGDITAIEDATWEKIFTFNKTYQQIKDHAKESTYADNNPEALVDNCLRIKAVYEFARVTETSVICSDEALAMEDKDNPHEALIENYKQKYLQPFAELIENKRQVISAQEAERAEKVRPITDQPHEKKIFFTPELYVRYEHKLLELRYMHPSTHELIEQSVWHGKIKAGQTTREGVAEELRKMLGYTGGFSLTENIFKTDTIQDKSGRDTERFKLSILLHDWPDIQQEVMGYELTFKTTSAYRYFVED